jgi:methionine aminopeptidase
VDPAARQLVDVTKQALDAAIAKCAPGVPYNVIGKTIQVRRAGPCAYGAADSREDTRPTAVASIPTRSPLPGACSS